MTERIIVTGEWRDIGLVKGIRSIQQKITDVGDGVRQTTEITKKYNKKLVKTGAVTKTITSTMGRFRAELLSVMFLGMAVARAFTGLLKPAAQNVGIMELWSTLLGLVFLPVMLALLPLFLKFMDFFLNLPEGTLMAIGVFVVFMAILGNLLMLVGILGLGFFGLQMFIATLAPVVASLAAIGLLPIIAVIGAVIAIVALLWFAWKNNFGNIRDWATVVWESIKLIFEGIKNIITGIIDVFVGFFTADGERIKKGFAKVWDGVKKIFEGAITALVKIIIGLGQLLFEAIIRGPAAILALLGAAFGFVWEELLIPAFEFGMNLIARIIAGVKAGAAKVGGAIKKVLGIGGGGGGTTAPSSQIGGIVPRDGVRFLHAGERVIPANQNINFNPSIIINVNRGMDEGSLLTRIKQELNEQFALGVGDIARR